MVGVYKIQLEDGDIVQNYLFMLPHMKMMHQKVLMETMVL